MPVSATDDFVEDGRAFYLRQNTPSTIPFKRQKIIKEDPSIKSEKNELYKCPYLGSKQSVCLVFILLT